MPQVRIFGGDPGLTVGPAESRDPSDLPRFVRRRLRRNPATAQSIREDQQSILIELPDHKELEILSPPAVARELGCTPGRVIQLIQEKKLEARQLGRTWLILRKGLERFVSAKGEEIKRRYARFLEGSDVGNSSQQKHGGRRSTGPRHRRERGPHRV